MVVHEHAADYVTPLFAAFDLEVLWNKTDRQATVFVEITEATLQAVPGILDPARTAITTTPPNRPQ